MLDVVGFRSDEEVTVRRGELGSAGLGAGSATGGDTGVGGGDAAVGGDVGLGGDWSTGVGF
ncbi:MAG: hypothetical protein ABSB29_06560 [Nitrososphaerales archaeon]